MKKWLYMTGAFVLGIVVASSAGTVSAKVQSLIGQKVTGELTVVVNGKELADKGAVINGRTSAPVRAVSEALGANLVLEGKTITITTDSAVAVPGSTDSTNKYSGRSKDSLEKTKKDIEENILGPTTKGKKELTVSLEEAKKGNDQTIIKDFEKRIAEYDAEIAKYTAEIEQIDAALKTLEK